MSEGYGSEIARHYAAYRPPLHELILGRLLAGQSFGMGLDIGCGTGQSSVPLVSYCDQVVGIDPSPEMLEVATFNPQIEYRVGGGGSIPIADRSADLVCFAGSLFYTHNSKTLEEVRRVASGACTVLVYDFELLLYDLLREIGLSVEEDNAYYDHTINLTGVQGFHELIRKEERVEVPVDANQMTHLILSTEIRYEACKSLFEVEDVFSAVLDLVHKLAPSALSADIYYAAYRCEPGR